MPSSAASRRLLLLRHGHPVVGSVDPGCAVDDEAKRAAQRHAARLARTGKVPELLVAAPTPAAQLTAAKAAKAMGIPVAAIRTDVRLTSEKRAPLRELLRELPGSAKRVLLIADRRPLHRLLRYVLGRRIQGDRRLAASTLASVALPDGWEASKGSGRLRERITADELPRLFPFPFPDGPERRQRPAYYYQQAAAIPIRRAPGGRGWDVLLVSSGARKHWGVPKGVVEPGFAPGPAAAREAYEEAGVEGLVAPEPLGSFAYDKWGAACIVATFALEVHAEHEPAARLEPHRHRQWLDASAAAARVKLPGLAQLIRTLAD